MYKISNILPPVYSFFGKLQRTCSTKEGLNTEKGTGFARMLIKGGLKIVVSLESEPPK